MKAIQWISPAVAASAAIAAGVALYQVSLMQKQVSQPPVFESLLSSDGASVDSHIDSRIEAFVEKKRQDAIQERLSRYAAVDPDAQGDKLVYGNKDARFSLVTYSDMECPYCKKFHNTPKSIVDASKGVINWQFVHFPLSFHNPAAMIEAHGTECVKEVAGPKQAWAFIDAVFSATAGNGSGPGDIAQVASSIGAPDQAFRECMSSGRYRDAISAGTAAAQKLGVTSTPTTIVVDRVTGENTIVSGFVEPDELVKVIRALGNKVNGAAE